MRDYKKIIPVEDHGRLQLKTVKANRRTPLLERFSRSVRPGPCHLTQQVASRVYLPLTSFLNHHVQGSARSVQGNLFCCHLNF